MFSFGLNNFVNLPTTFLIKRKKFYVYLIKKRVFIYLINTRV